ncbi:ArsB/NhaD family transporter [Dehalobacter sp. DCM]|uniref:SLC13 family permease n=1 Tax=Dehalobacter sp. DCM TaxID=2907827 RepID=UPI0030821804|nr:ArsB/NhaD family transporter [Dehalobacter sp. DCM]
MSHNTQVIVAAVIFLTTYAFIISEKIHRTVVALVGSAFVILVGILNQEEAIEAIDFNTIGLLIGMMIIVGITRRTGVFEFLALKAAKLAKGDPWLIMLFLAVLTAIASAFLDNVTTVMLMVPVTFSITEKLSINPIPFLLTQVIASNIGGTATLIGDPPNIMIGSATGLTFVDFILNLGGVIVIIFIATMVALKLIYRKSFHVDDDKKVKIMSLDESQAIKDHFLLRKCLGVLAVTICGFMLHGMLHLESATIALAGASVLLLITREEPEDILLSVEWPTIFFFAGLFVLVGALEHVGIIEWIAKKALDATGGSLPLTTMSVLWLSAIASAFIDNIPFVATMIPLIQKIGEMGGIENLRPLWWALSLGACLGGNGTLIGASANVIVAGLAEKQGFSITFKMFFKLGFPLMLLSVVIASAYVYFVYLI